MATKAVATIASAPVSRVWLALTIQPRTDWLSEFSSRPTRLGSNTRCVQKPHVEDGASVAETANVASRVATAPSAARNRLVTSR